VDLGTSTFPLTLRTAPTGHTETEGDAPNRTHAGQEDTMQLRSLEDLLALDLQDLETTEQQILQALPKMMEAAANDELRAAFQQHRVETEEHLRRLSEIMAEFDLSPAGQSLRGIGELLAKGEEILKADGDPAVKDAALIGAAQKIEHYEMAAYGTARSLAAELGHEHAAELLDQTLEEEKEADKLLNKIATGGLLRSGVNARAAR
jgi:ferritin-like metal-binding protein YciE